MSLATPAVIHRSGSGRISWTGLAWSVAVIATIGAVSAALAAIFFVAPVESTMGEAQKIVYLHVSVAWCGLCGCIVMGGAGVGYLAGRGSSWDRAAQAAGEIGWLCGTLTLVTGSLWAHVAWGTWWTWDPRLTTMLVLWMLYAGYFLTRASIDEPRRRARVSAVLALLATADLPLVVFATRWFRGIHPVSPEMDPRMRTVLLISVAAFSLLFTLLAVGRYQLLRRANEAADHEASLANHWDDDESSAEENEMTGLGKKEAESCRI